MPALTVTVTVTWANAVVLLCGSIATYCIGSVLLDYRDHPKVRRVLWGINA